MISLFKGISSLFGKTQWRPLEKKLGYKFKNIRLLKHALVHRSYVYENEGTRKDSNERMEFLGDSILNMIVSDYLYSTFPKKQEGDLSKIKSLVVSKKILGEAANKLGIGKFIYLSEAESKAGGRKRISIGADAFEAITAAIYLDGGHKKAKNFITNTILYDISTYLDNRDYVNYKSALLEATQKLGLGMPSYRVNSESGPDHNKTFEINVMIKNECWGTGTGKSKKEAEQEAARNAIETKRELIKVF